MVRSLIQMNDVKNNLDEKWLIYLYKTKEKNYNINNVNSINEINKYSVFNYVKRTLEILNRLKEEQKLTKDIVYYVEETLKWSEVAKTGRKGDIKKWQKKNYDIYCHNIGSSQIYLEENNDEIVYILIKTHGLIGQYVKGEIKLNKNIELYNLVKNKKITKNKLRTILIILNQAIIEAISKDLYNKVEKDIKIVIDKVISGNLEENEIIIDRMKKLNKNLSEKEITYLNKLDIKVTNVLQSIFNSLELWYYDSALSEFQMEEQVKILLFIYPNSRSNCKHLTFEKLMHDLYLDYKNKKEVNIYKKRIIETYLKEISITDILENNINPNPHITYDIKINDLTMVFNFKFSIQAKKLIEFCEAASNSNSLYQKATYILYDLFGFRRDDYDRFYNEIDYLNTMNSALKEKSIILNYLVGNSILDVGPGGGVVMDLIEKTRPELQITGIDLSQNVIDKLTEKKIKEQHNWNIVKGDALNLSKYFKENSIDTIIYSSIIHELYSYIETDGKKFNQKTIKIALQEAYKILAKKGRIIIRDGIMTSPTNQYRLIEFKNTKDLEILNNYCHDFKGRKIYYQKIDENTVKMLVNDAMEFLYTYTWGEQSYPLEVKEQFGYFTIEEYINFIKEILPNCKIIVSKSYLQEGYEKNLLPKINIYDENKKVVKLPDSTSIIVIEKE